MNRFIAMRASLIIGGVLQPTLCLAALYFYAWEWGIFWVVLPMAFGSVIPALPVLCSDPEQGAKLDKASLPPLGIGCQPNAGPLWMDQFYLCPYLNNYTLAATTLIAVASMFMSVRNALRLRPTDEF